ncbi:hypothetical protein SLA2020_154830 [Shorea laevis]
MVRYQISFEKPFIKKGTWTPEEDRKLLAYIGTNGIRNWKEMPKYAGLSRTGKSCRLRWMNYLRPDIKHGNFTKEEEETILKLQKTMGNSWTKIAKRLPNRTDNEIKNLWNSRLKKRVMENSIADDHEAKQDADDHEAKQGMKSVEQRNTSFPDTELYSLEHTLSPDTVLRSPTLQDFPVGADPNGFAVQETNDIIKEENSSLLKTYWDELVEDLREQPVEDSQTTIINENFMTATSQLWLYESTYLCDSNYASDPVDDFWASSSI